MYRVELKLTEERCYVFVMNDDNAMAMINAVDSNEMDSIYVCIASFQEKKFAGYALFVRKHDIRSIAIIETNKSNTVINVFMENAQELNNIKE